MSKLFVVQVVNSNISVQAEFENNEQGAIVNFHQRCATLWNAADVYHAKVKILDEGLNLFQDKEEYITHPQPEPEPEPEPEEA